MLQLILLNESEKVENKMNDINSRMARKDELLKISEKININYKNAYENLMEELYLSS